jgi:hypothetical protein
MGNIKPDNRITGNINPIKETIIAVCWDAEMVEIKIPNDKALIMNNRLSAPKRKRLPCTGILKTKMLNRIMIMALMTARSIYGTTFPIMT